MAPRRLGALVSLLATLGASGCTNEESPAPRTQTTSESAVPSGAPEECSQEKVPQKRRDVRAVAFARGDGPVYVGLGSPDAIRYTVDTREHGGWYYYKTLWAIEPTYSGAATVTGFQLDGPHRLRFNAAAGFPGDKVKELVFDAAIKTEWRYGPSETLIRADGCYAFRIRGQGFVDWVTFVARA